MSLSRYILAFASILLVGACGEKPTPEPAPEPAPVLVSSVPEDGAEDIKEGTLDIVLTYDQNIKCLMANQAKIKIGPDAKVVKVNPYNTTLTISVEGLQAGTEYTLEIPEGAVEGYKENQPGAKALKLKFTTKQGELPPDSETLPEKGDNIAWKMAEKLGLGWNLGNQMDAFINWNTDRLFYPDETCWGNAKCTQATMTGVRTAGFKTVRIPITWLKMIGPAPDYKIDDAWLNRVAEIVNYAKEAGLNVIINTHHDEDLYLGSESLGHRWLNILDAAKNKSVNDQVKDEVSKVWTQIAEKLKNEGDYLIFESFNEINDGGWGWSTEFQKDPAKQCDVLNEWNQVFVDAVRATGGNNAERWLGVPTYAANPTFTKYFRMPTDKAGHTMLAVHCYDPGSFTIGDEQYPQWGHTGQVGKKDPFHDESSLRSTFSALNKNYVEKGIPVYLGEFGCSMRDKNNTTAWNFYLYYLEYVVKAAKTYGLPCFLWDNGAEGAGKEKHGYLNHGTGSYIGNSQEAIKVMVKAMYDETLSYTLQSVYDKAPRP